MHKWYNYETGTDPSYIGQERLQTMQEIRDRIVREGSNLGRGILKVDSFINHQVDAKLMMNAGRELGRRFANVGVDKVLTAEISGIAPALTTALALNVPVIYARKTKPITMPEVVYREQAPSHTKGHLVDHLVSPEVLHPQERVLIVDDFLATGQTIAALGRIVQRSGAVLVGVGTVIEKTFEGGRAFLMSQFDVPVESLVTITSMSDGHIVFADQ
jgi:xanthine phosphoribosyltransferase